MVLETATQNQGSVVANKTSHNFKFGANILSLFCVTLFFIYNNIISILVSLRTLEQFY